MKIIFLLLFALLLFAHSFGQPQKQRSSPMTDNVRKHQRIPELKYAGISVGVKNILPDEFEIYIPEDNIKADTLNLLFHFHGSADVVKYAAENFDGEIAAVSINLGAGSSVYSKPFLDQNKFKELLTSVEDSIQNKLNKKIFIDEIHLSGFSAGYGAVREILRNKNYFDRINKVLLLDGIHASYIPEGVNLYDGGKIDSTDLDSFLETAKVASKNSSKKFIITHSEIYPGTYVSTTEASDYLLNELNIERKAVLEWGPLGMQQISEAKKGGFYVLGFAGNSAPDHIDHLQALYYFLNLFEKM